MFNCGEGSSYELLLPYQPLPLPADKAAALLQGKQEAASPGIGAISLALGQAGGAGGRLRDV